jgi:hypothetical protein
MPIDPTKTDGVGSERSAQTEVVDDPLVREYFIEKGREILEELYGIV